MKKMIKMLTVATAMFLSTSSIAESGELVVMEVTGQTTFKLILNDLKEGLTIQLKDQYGYILHQEEVQGTDTYARLYNLKELPNGNYYLELDYGTKTKVHSLLITGGQVYNQKSQPREFFKPVLRQKEDQLIITHLSPKKATLKVAIYDSKNQLILKDKLNGSMDLGRRYDISALKPGNYQVYLASEGRSYSHSLQLQQP